MREDEYLSFMAGDMPPWLGRLQSRVEKTILNRGLFRPGDKVLCGLSGGKDSLCLVLCLALCRRRPGMAMGLEAALVDWKEAPLGDPAIGRVGEFCRALGVPLHVLGSSFPKQAGNASPTCYGCARKRKELVFSEAGRLGFGVVAFGHHLDDAAVTALMNLMGRGRIEGMGASREFFGGRLRLVRPLIDVPEASLAHAAERLGLPVASIDCPHRLTNARDRLKPVMRRLRGSFPRSRDYLARLGEKSLNLRPNDAKVGEG